jgi:hypothetical protein
MRRQCAGGIACITLFALAAVGLAGRIEAAGAGGIDTATTAAQASPELIGALSKEIGATPEQAAGAAGALFGLAKSRLEPDQFSKLAKAVPGMDLLLKAAPGASGDGGPAGALEQIAGSVGGLPAVASQFSKLGLKPEMAPKAASALVSFLTKSGGAGLGKVLAGALK